MSYDKVKKIIEKENCILVSDQYINSKEKLLIKCFCGEEALKTIKQEICLKMNIVKTKGLFYLEYLIIRSKI